MSHREQQTSHNLAAGASSCVKKEEESKRGENRPGGAGEEQVVWGCDPLVKSPMSRFLLSCNHFVCSNLFIYSGTGSEKADQTLTSRYNKQSNVCRRKIRAGHQDLPCDPVKMCHLSHKKHILSLQTIQPKEQKVFFPVCSSIFYLYYILWPYIIVFHLPILLIETQLTWWRN